tara:strand:+ start:13368 stop:13616 length:249 start_codon:yes stop_codon:yes gene_type:complete
MKKILNWFNDLIRHDTTTSSKRFIALYIVIVLITYVVFRYTNKSNIELILVELLGAVTVLMGVASWQNVRNKQNKNDKTGNI